ncbi:MAG: hypothetical protein VX941_10915 [Pseudomonadota bacterium]|nr:hypothetical protein [Pseudomonadota bacterium]
MPAALIVPLLKDTGFYTFMSEIYCDGRVDAFASYILRQRSAFVDACRLYPKSITPILTFLALM